MLAQAMSNEYCGGTGEIFAFASTKKLPVSTHGTKKQKILLLQSSPCYAGKLDAGSKMFTRLLKLLMFIFQMF